MTQFFAQNLAGKRRKPETMARRHWDAIAREMGYRPTDLRRRVQDLVDAIVASRISVAKAVVDLPGVTPGYVEQAAEMIESNALRIAGRLE